MTLDDALLAFYRLQEERFEGVAPTLREFQAECGFSSTSVAAHWIEVLQEDGLIYTPAPLLGKDSARVRKLSWAGLQRAYLLLEAVA